MVKSSLAEISPRNRILDAAEELFARRGFAGVGMSEIAETVGLSKSSLFHHFHTKAQLYAATVDRILGEVDSTLTRSLAQGGSAAQRLDRWVDSLIYLLATTPAHSRLLLRSLFEDDELSGDIPEQQQADRALRRILQQVSNVLRDGMAQGEIRAASIPHTLQSLIGIVVFHFASGEFGDDVIGGSIFAAKEVERRKREVKATLRHGIFAGAAQHTQTTGGQ